MIVTYTVKTSFKAFSIFVLHCINAGSPLVWKYPPGPTRRYETVYLWSPSEKNEYIMSVW